MIKTSVNLDELLDVYSEPNSKVTLTAVTMTASQKIPATETHIPSISLWKLRAATAHHIGKTIEVIITR
ncbi:hypothetical protein [Microcoleus sp. AT8-B2]|uniref:hypothetical protein n=1 Tax=Microcoleus sp. AT8-B2 TaxID=2818618 RepID=UPI002FCF4353